MLDHIVEFLTWGWQELGGPITARSPMQAVIRAAAWSGHYRVRRVGDPTEVSEYFWVPAWGKPVPIQSP